MKIFVIFSIVVLFYINSSFSESTSELLCSYCKSAVNDVRSGFSLPENYLISYTKDFYDVVDNFAVSDEVNINM